MRKALFLLLFLFPFAALPQSSGAIRVYLEVVADSSNRIVVEVQVAPNTNGRELMDRLFKMEYVDFTKRFVIGIAGFKVSPQEKQFWKLELDGVDSQIGIAEVLIKRETRLRWSVAKF